MHYRRMTSFSERKLRESSISFCAKLELPCLLLLREERSPSCYNVGTYLPHQPAIRYSPFSVAKAAFVRWRHEKH